MEERKTFLYIANAATSMHIKACETLPLISGHHACSNTCPPTALETLSTVFPGAPEEAVHFISMQAK